MVLIKLLVDQCATGCENGRTRTNRRASAARAQGSDALAAFLQRCRQLLERYKTGILQLSTF
jgi:hypothetical protein